MAVQFSQTSRETIQRLLERYPTRRAVMLPALHLAMREFPYIDDDVCQAVADLLAVPMVDVKGVATFYSLFPTEPHGQYSLEVCINLSCSLNGARHCLRYLEHKLGIKAGDTTSDGRFTLRGMECLAACDQAPMMYINNEVMHTKLTEAKLDQILDELA
ncbi:MAG: NAD(P)H-dependent oxidoreductase subunit E [Candidatus Tectomicrobia bacterium]|uniref:NAD(P)H-dependent oxidoreductase subunit E n=1 Tax=Tectimicrobiota bacterium TaxID=2528274 RepID=A0A938B5T4_UNCTE|nr:NAD(P)H-dependent oxidoreductase subunit E [Candidatus Tectomicrobia bacterium]